MANDVIIEIRGGCLVGVYFTPGNQRVIFLDWDDLNELPEELRTAAIFPPDSLDEMPPDTRCVCERGLARDREPTR
jgi:hypothetical protein